MSPKSTSVMHTLPLRIVAISPAPRTMYALQLGTDRHVPSTSNDASQIVFDFSVEAEEDSSTGSFRLRGPAVQGPKGKRFVYLGVRWHVPVTDVMTGGRVKITLESITPEQIRKAVSDPSRVLEAEFEATGKNGLPMCASVKLLGGGWHLR